MAEASPPALETRDLSLWYGTFQALFGVTLTVQRGLITSMIGPSGCGKSTLLRSVNRINDRLGYVRVSGAVEVLGHDIFDPAVELAQLRKQAGMVFQRPNPLPLSVRENVVFGLRLHTPRRLTQAELAEATEGALRQVMLWDEVKDRLDQSALELSLEQQQKLCIARLLPLKPSLLLMDEPCSALDPKGTEAVEELLWELRGAYTILLVTHNMAQARRASEECVFLLHGRLIEHRPTTDVFLTPEHQETADYIEGRYG